MNVEFSELAWHDAELLDIEIDRRNPGENDQIIIHVAWPNGEQNSLVFSDCFGLEAKMNFGVVAPESIFDASVMKESQELAEIRKKWDQIGVGLEKLKCFEIKTNSTASLLRIYALGFSLKD
jgi:hypothetical protein